MRYLTLAALLALTACGAAVAPLKQEVACTTATVREAARGDFSRWVLPAWVPGRHLRAGERVDCMP